MGRAIVTTALNAVPIASSCDSLWGRNQCPNPAEWIVRVTDCPETLFVIMCGPHKEGYQDDYPDAAVEYIPYSLEVASDLQAKVLEEEKADGDAANS